MTLHTTPEVLVRILDMVTADDETARDPTPDELDDWMHGGDE
jgi:hypothetical protein